MPPCPNKYQICRCKGFEEAQIGAPFHTVLETWLVSAPSVCMFLTMGHRLRMCFMSGRFKTILTVTEKRKMLSQLLIYKLDELSFWPH